MAVELARLADAAIQAEQGPAHGPAVGTDAEVGLALHSAEEVHGPVQDGLHRQIAADGRSTGDAQPLSYLFESLLVQGGLADPAHAGDGSSFVGLFRLLRRFLQGQHLCKAQSQDFSAGENDAHAHWQGCCSTNHSLEEDSGCDCCKRGKSEADPGVICGSHPEHRLALGSVS